MIGNKLKTIAEIASAHGGSPKELMKILNNYSKLGFDSFKLQIFKLDELVNTNQIKDSPLKAIEINNEDWHIIFNHILEDKKHSESNFKNIDFIAEPYDFSSLNICREYDFFHAYKIPTSDFSNLSFIDQAAEVSNNIYLGTGGSTFTEIKNTIKYIYRKFPLLNIKLIHGFQAYPTSIEDMDLWKINFLKKEFNVSVGFADHADASSSLLRFLPSSIAIQYGADFIEKHITIDRSEKKPDYYSSLEPNEVNEFMQCLYYSYQLFNENFINYELPENELIYRRSMKKYACCSKIIYKGDRLTENNISYKRCTDGYFTLFDSQHLYGKVSCKDIQPGQVIVEDDILIE